MSREALRDPRWEAMSETLQKYLSVTGVLSLVLMTAQLRSR
jgi:hypothetical protein